MHKLPQHILEKKRRLSYKYLSWTQFQNVIKHVCKISLNKKKYKSRLVKHGRKLIFFWSKFKK